MGERSDQLGKRGVESTRAIGTSRQQLTRRGARRQLAPPPQSRGRFERALSRPPPLSAFILLWKRKSKLTAMMIRATQLRTRCEGPTRVCVTSGIFAALHTPTPPAQVSPHIAPIPGGSSRLSLSTVPHPSIGAPPPAAAACSLVRCDLRRAISFSAKEGGARGGLFRVSALRHPHRLSRRHGAAFSIIGPSQRLIGARVCVSACACRRRVCFFLCSCWASARGRRRTGGAHRCVPSRRTADRRSGAMKRRQCKETAAARCARCRRPANQAPAFEPAEGQMGASKFEAAAARAREQQAMGPSCPPPTTPAPVPNEVKVRNA